MSSYELERLEVGEPGVVRVRLAGELDLTNVRALEAHLVQIAPPDARLVVDLNRVVFVDSAALHMLFKLARRQEQGKLVLILEPSALIAKAIAIVGLDQAAQLSASADELPAAAPLPDLAPRRSAHVFGRDRAGTRHPHRRPSPGKGRKGA